ncbi:MAG: iron-containing alcohol dehydrogenase, partial [Eubacterium sp.]|nr:iron-containing alcohol dehydrogenase [Eubacterium sp.]
MQQLYDQIELNREEILFDLQEIGEKHGVDSVFVVSGGTYKRTYLPKYFDVLGWKVTHFPGFSPNPDYKEVCDGVDKFRESKAKLIVAVGGGSAMDTAKAIKLYADMTPGTDYMKEEVKPADVPFLAVPTTAGTGSDGNGNIVFYRDGVKQSLNHAKVVPEYLLFEPKFLVSLPEYQKKSTLADALCQCIESIWAKGATEESTEYAMEGLSLIYENMLRYLRGDIESFPAIQRGAYLSGRAINISKTTAAHALSYKMSSDFNIAHGHAVLMMISPVCRSIEEYLIHDCGIKTISVLNPPYDKPVDELTDAEKKKIEEGPRYFTDKNGEQKEIPADTRELLEKIKKIMSVLTPGKNPVRNLHKQISFIARILDIESPEYPGEDKLRELAAAVNVERLGNNPISYSQDDLVDLYIRAFNKVRVGTLL